MSDPSGDQGAEGSSGRSWQPRRGGWTLTLLDSPSGGIWRLSDRHGDIDTASGQVHQLEVRPHPWKWWSASLHVPRMRGTGREIFSGLSRRTARDLTEVLHAAAFEAQVAPTLAWYRSVEEAFAAAVTGRRWVSTEQVQRLVAAHPGPCSRTGRPVHRLLTDVERAALDTDPAALPARAAAVNAQVEAATLAQDRGFFDTIETSPLTAEQARAVYTYDNRVHVIAAAGSGKTSVMVGRAAYAIQRGFTTPKKVLLLAFNTAAAAELRDRVEARFAAAGLPTEGLLATTFHAFGLHVIGAATGRKPSVAPWVADNKDVAMVADIVADLKAHDPVFATAWDTFRLLYSRLPDDPNASAEPDTWDARRGLAGFATLAGPVVRSHGERLLADWLYVNHVDFEYERPYTHQTATGQRRQYHPDFYYPAIDTWHEHWGLDANGNPPPGFDGYRESMAWKRALHRRHGTALIETTWAHVMDGTDLPRLARELTARGVTLRWDPQRAAGNGRATPEGEVHRLVRTFMTHVKANSLTRDHVTARVGTLLRNPHRAGLFLTLYWAIHAQWQARLAAGGYIDFEDMLILAAQHLEDGNWTSPYELVMVDEFQDASRARARLTRALVATPDRYLLAVGDDWQSINRFAGSDLALVTHFHDYFGPGPDVHLSTTFRCHQDIATAASTFITANPTQQVKTVTSVHTQPARSEALEGIHLHEVKTTGDTRRGIEQVLTELEDAAAAGHIRTRDGLVTVDVLGRYRFEQQHVPARPWRHLRVTFRTVHSAKGLEADYVIVPNMTAGTFGFPSQIVDDPVLSLPMAQADPYPHAEERRLFYVALTRARRGVHLITPSDTPSPFVTELLTRRLAHPHGNARAVVCPTCQRGVLRPRQSRYGQFYGCSTFPACRHTVTELPHSPGYG